MIFVQIWSLYVPLNYFGLEEEGIFFNFETEMKEN